MNFKTKNYFQLPAWSNPLNWRKMLVCVMVVSLLMNTNLFANITLEGEEGDFPADSTITTDSTNYTDEDDWDDSDSTFVDWDEEENEEEYDHSDSSYYDEEYWNDEDEYEGEDEDWYDDETVEGDSTDFDDEDWNDEDEDWDDEDEDWNHDDEYDEDSELAEAMDELGIEDEEEFWAYVDSLEDLGYDFWAEFYGEDYDGDYDGDDDDWFGDDEDEDGDVDWDDFFWGWDDEDYEDEEECSFDTSNVDTDCDWDDEDDYTEEDESDDEYYDESDELAIIMTELGFDDEEEFWSYVDSLEDEGVNFWAEFYGEDSDWDDEDDYDGECYVDSTDFEEADCYVYFEYTADTNGVVSFTTTHDGALEFFYDFGDGNTSSDENPSNGYPFSGTYEACVYAYDSINDCLSSYCDLVDVEITGDSLECEVIIFIDWNEGSEEYDFSVEYDCGNRGDYNVFWQFGDLTTSKELTPSYIYTVERDYQVTAFIVNSENKIVGTVTKQFSYRKTEANAIEETALATELKEMISSVYPNPTVDQISIDVDLAKGGDVLVKVTDMFGRTVLSESNTQSVGQQRININVSELPTGTYHINTMVEGQSGSKTFMKIN